MVWEGVFIGRYMNGGSEFLFRVVNRRQGNLFGWWGCFSYRIANMEQGCV